MTVNKLIKYCLETPRNINPAIIKQMAEDLMENGEVFASVNGQKFTNLTDAISAAPANAVVNIFDDVDEKQHIEVNKNLTINLNGNKLHSNNNFLFHISNEATLIINGDENSIIDSNIAVGKGTGSNGHLVVNGGNFIISVPDEAVFQTNGNCKNSTITVKNAKLKGLDIALYLPADGKYIFENCEIEGHTGLYVKSGEVELINCKVRGNGAFAEPIPNGNGAVGTGDAIILDSKQGYTGSMKLSIKGNSILKSDHGYAIQEALTDLTSSATIALNIEDGSFTGKKQALKTSEAFSKGVKDNKIECSISGGIYSSMIEEEYLAEGKECISNGIKFIVK